MNRNPFRRLGAAYGAEEIKTHNFFLGLDWRDVYDRKLVPLNVKAIRPYRANNFKQSITDDAGRDNMPMNLPNWSFVRGPGDNKLASLDPKK